MQQIMTIDRGAALVLRLGVQRLVPLGFVLSALVLAGVLVQVVSAM